MNTDSCFIALSCDWTDCPPLMLEFAFVDSVLLPLTHRPQTGKQLLFPPSLDPHHSPQEMSPGIQPQPLP